MFKNTFVIITCEHAGAEIPVEYKALFNSSQAQNLLASHRGQDFGALSLAQKISHALPAPLFFTEISRLIVDCNRSLNHPHLFSEFSKILPKNERAVLIEKYYIPYRNRIEKEIESAIKQGLKVLHFSIHSFTPSLNKEDRNADIGLLYDPKRIQEKEFSKRLKQNLQKLSKEIRIRFNYPYRGVSDGFTSYLRKKWGPGFYCGLELEINQNLFLNQNKINQYYLSELQNTLVSLLSQKQQPNESLN